MAQLEDLVTFLSVQVSRVVVLVSLGSHLVLAAFSEIRRRKAHGWQRKLVWFAYQMTDWAPTYVLGNLYLETAPRDKLIIAFWLPFLLQHHARPDNISANSMEDNKTWSRQMLFVLLQIPGAGYVLYRYILTGSADGILRKASWISFFLGIVKYAESAEALRRGNLDFIRSSFKRRELIRYDGGKNTDDDDEALLAAHDLFDICKGAFSDYSVDIDHDAIKSIFSGDWENMCKVVEMELSLMYDILYTKTPVVNTWVGYAIRVASPPLTATVIVLFYLHSRDCMKTEDFVITQILLWTTFFLDLRWLLRALASTWTHSFLKVRPHCWFNHEILCQGLWRKLRCFVVSLCISKLSLWLWTCDCAKEAKSYRRWARKIRQRNLLDECTDDDARLHIAVGRNETEPEYQYRSREIEVPHYVMKLVFGNICTKFFPAPVPAGYQGPENGSTHGDDDTPPNPEGSTGSVIHSTNGNDDDDQPRPNHQGSTDLGNLGGIPTCRPEGGLPSCRWFDNWWDRWLVAVPRQAENAPPGHPYEQQADHLSLGYSVYMYDEPQPEPSEQHVDHGRDGHAGFLYDHHSPPPEAPYEQAHHHLRHSRSASHTNATYVQAMSYHKERDAVKSPKSEGEGKEFPLEFQEVILIWHIATDVFLSCSPSIKGAESEEHVDAIKGMSNYMVFLVAERPTMLPGLKLRSVYETTRHALRRALKEIRKKRFPSKKEHASWMLEGKVTLTGPETATVREGTKHARLLLSLLLPDEERPRGKHTLGPKLAHWIPDLKKPPTTMEGMLKFILNAWVHMLIYASIRCSRESHSEQLGRGGELTTLLWIISEHTGTDLVKEYSPGYFHDDPQPSS